MCVCVCVCVRKLPSHGVWCLLMGVVLIAVVYEDDDGGVCICVCVCGVCECTCIPPQYRGKGEYGELGYGPKGKKSSANPDKVPSLDGTPTLHVACGMGHTLFVVASDHADKLPVWENTIEEQPPRVADGGGGRGGKRKAGGEGGKGSKKAK